MKKVLEGKPQISPRDKVQLLNELTMVINYWQDEEKASIRRGHFFFTRMDPRLTLLSMPRRCTASMRPGSSSPTAPFRDSGVINRTHGLCFATKAMGLAILFFLGLVCASTDVYKETARLVCPSGRLAAWARRGRIDHWLPSPSCPKRNRTRLAIAIPFRTGSYAAHVRQLVCSLRSHRAAGGVIDIFLFAASNDLTPAELVRIWVAERPRIR